MANIQSRGFCEHIGMFSQENLADNAVTTSPSLHKLYPDSPCAQQTSYFLSKYYRSRSVV